MACLCAELSQRTTAHAHAIVPSSIQAMAKSLVGALALASLPSALAFRNTSPYFLFSTAACVPTPLDDASRLTAPA
jgi:hypothetical protein